jgi:hypothetical protein
MVHPTGKEKSEKDKMGVATIHDKLGHINHKHMVLK